MCRFWSGKCKKKPPTVLSLRHSELSNQNFSMDFQFQQANFISLQKLPIMKMHDNHGQRATDHLLLNILLTYLLTPWCRVLFEQPTGLQQVKISLRFTEPEGSLQRSQASATCVYPGPAQSGLYKQIPPPGVPS